MKLKTAAFWCAFFHPFCCAAMTSPCLRSIPWRRPRGVAAVLHDVDHVEAQGMVGGLGMSSRAVITPIAAKLFANAGLLLLLEKHEKCTRFIRSARSAPIIGII
jgi:hypothetical protein